MSFSLLSLKQPRLFSPNVWSLGHLLGLQKHLVFNEVMERDKNSQDPWTGPQIYLPPLFTQDVIEVLYFPYTLNNICPFISIYSTHLLMAAVARCCSEALSTNV